ncbi:type II toxin-antitoxin system HicA family toxin [Lentilactobacillus sp. IMAU92037]|uniref:type II toxin-antitoxin system HicA family toxin n=1 Tax=Lentilactobacillus TaxID=2767893 RepID=UPI001C27F19E|nr:MULTISPECIES: type II toxin-antitoxin system HicA family toxin [Lentilactobacillus]MBU9789640.1 type II toxin-antitoxin system HicA family toxin [Lentilactobacillus dabitei]MBV0929410.1 type II toxin-antitoxin system HicA family toxin [Lentilactobacillus dabitei]MDM7515792.1 type II toxin-antitoxin system HicA family toxin [Lentilactobacillus sp. TOM.63]
MKVTVKQVLEMLSAQGFVEDRIKGDHHRFVDQYGHKVTVPYSRLKQEVSLSTYHYIKRQAGIK